MYQYDRLDQAFVKDRVAEFSDQVDRRLKGELSEDAFKPLRLMNGLYLQLHAYMLRVAIPYGTLSARQMHRLAEIARDYDKGFGHFTTRQNIQFNWIKLSDAPAILAKLAEVDMHALQTSGNCIRNVTTDVFAGACRDEVEDPRIIAEIIRQWSSIHPEFSYLPRKFKIAITGSEIDRAAIRAHDIGLHLTPDGIDVYVGGGLGRTPHIAPLIKKSLPAPDLISYLEACLRVYNRYGRRDNIYKARIKILVAALGADEYQRQVEEEWQTIDRSRTNVPEAEVERIRAQFPLPDFVEGGAIEPFSDRGFARWLKNNSHPHRREDHLSIVISTKPEGAPPGDADVDQMMEMARLAGDYGYGELRVSHTQNVVLPHVAKKDVRAVYEALKECGLASANHGLLTDQICCPGLDYCTLANARSIPLAQDISRAFANEEKLDEIGNISLKMSGCINACGHHHIGHIGILGVDKQGIEYYQILLGGRADEQAFIGEITGKGLKYEEVVPALSRLVDRYLELRLSADEPFIDTLTRLGAEPFKEAIHEH